MNVQKKVEKRVVPASIERMLESGDIVQLKQADGSTEFSINVQNDMPWHHKEKLHTAHFVLPNGYDKLAFTIETRYNEGEVAEARWASDNPDDSRIVVHVKTSSCLKAHDGITACVHSVYGKKKLDTG